MEVNPGPEAAPDAAGRIRRLLPLPVSLLPSVRVELLSSLSRCSHCGDAAGEFGGGGSAQEP